MIMGPILAFVTGGIGKYLALGVLATGLLTWFVYDLKAPLKREIAALHSAAEKKEAISEADTIRADVAEAELTKAQAQLESLINDTKSSCRLSSGDRQRLQQLAAGQRAR
jgi:hypothetical protein